jgi:type IV secretory pathway TrbD component
MQELLMHDSVLCKVVSKLDAKTCQEGLKVHALLFSFATFQIGFGLLGWVVVSLSMKWMAPDHTYYSTPYYVHSTYLP